MFIISWLANASTVAMIAFFIAKFAVEWTQIVLFGTTLSFGDPKFLFGLFAVWLASNAISGRSTQPTTASYRLDHDLSFIAFIVINALVAFKVATAMMAGRRITGRSDIGIDDIVLIAGFVGVWLDRYVFQKEKRAIVQTWHDADLQQVRNNPPTPTPAPTQTAAQPTVGRGVGTTFVVLLIILLAVVVLALLSGNWPISLTDLQLPPSKTCTTAHFVAFNQGLPKFKWDC